LLPQEKSIPEHWESFIEKEETAEQGARSRIAMGKLFCFFWQKSHENQGALLNV